jgi:two-component system, LuxR family, sensor kinase FixL
MSTNPGEARRIAVQAVVLATGYYVGVEIGLAFTLVPNAVSLLWPPNAIVLAALLLSHPRRWVWLVAAVLPPHLLVQLSAGVPLPMSLCWYVSNLSEALIGAWIIRGMLQHTPRFDLVRDASVFLVGGVLIAPLVSSFLDAAFVAWVGWRYDGDYWAVWRMRLFSNALATVTFVPLIVSIGSAKGRSLLEATRARGFEAAVLLLLLAITSWFVFYRPYAPGEGATYVYAPLPLIVWAAVRLGVGGVASCIAVVALVSITGEMDGVGPFARARPEDAVSSLQIFLIIAATSLMVFAASLSELQHARATALRRKETLDLALSAARMGVWEWDVAADRFTWQKALEDTSTTISTLELTHMVHSDDRALLTTTMQRIRDGEDLSEFECRFVRDKAVHWVMGKGKHSRRTDGRPHRIIGVWMDITDSKQQVARERSQREQLAHLSRVAMLGELSGAITHELGQPLAAILFNAEAGLRSFEKGDGDAREMVSILEDIIAADMRAAEVIRRLRALFKKGEVQKESIDVRDCIQGVLSLEHSDLIGRGIATKLQLDRDIPLVNADPIQLQQVLLNLIVNASEAMSAATISQKTLQISACKEDAENLVHIRVSDSGEGIEHPEKIFEPFFTTKKNGMGLGLTISRSIVGANGGRLWATNNADGGATLHLTLAVHVDPQTSSEVAEGDSSRQVQALSAP